MTAKIEIRQYVIFFKRRKFDTADIKCFTVIIVFLKYLAFCVSLFLIVAFPVYLHLYILENFNFRIDRTC